MKYDEETQSFVIESPLYVIVGRKKFMLNMNDYRNAHYQVLNKAKIEYKKLLRDDILSLPAKMGRISIDYEIILGDNRRHDGMNIVSVTSKFFLDALVEYGVIEDDNTHYVLHEEWNIRPSEKGNGRVIIFIKPM